VAVELRPLALLLTATGQACVLGATELLGRRGLGPEQTRRVGHVAGACSVAVLPRFLTLTELGALAVFFTGLLAWTRVRRQLPSVHGVRRPTVGALVFPAGLFLGVWVGWGHPLAIAYGALVLALADPSAGWVGDRCRGLGWNVVGGRKTVIGSVVFASVTVLVGAALIGVSSGRLLLVVPAALVLAALEASVGYGLDNLPIPPMASLLATAWLGL
jgi:dolichol kinase